MATKKNTTVSTRGKEYSYYRITRTIGHEYKDGKKVPIKKQFIGTSKGNAEQKYKEYLQEEAEKKHRKIQEAQALQLKKFGEYAKEFNETILPKLPYVEGTISAYATKYRTHVKDTWITELPIHQITIKTIEKFYSDLDVSKQQLDGINKWMAAFFRWLSVNEYAVNVIPSVRIPKKKDNSRHDDIVVWEQDEISTIIKASEGHRLHLLFVLLYYSGLRISEALGLKYSDIDNGAINVNRQYARGTIAPPKANSYRSIPAHKAILDALAIHTQWHKEEMNKSGYSTEFIFTSSSGKLLDYHNVSRSMSRLYARNNIQHKKIHAYRSTFCTELCRNGVAIEVASKLMGHKSIEVTAKHYALVRSETKVEAINKLPTI